MEVKMNKDIREYKSKNSLNLTLVQTFVGVIGVIASGFTIFALRRAIGPGTPVPAFVGTAVMLPFALIGDFGPKIQGLSTRTFVLLWFRFLFLEKRITWTLFSSLSSGMKGIRFDCSTIITCLSFE